MLYLASSVVVAVAVIASVSATANEVVSLQTATMGIDAPMGSDGVLGGVALQLKELEAMKERGTLNDMTFKHAVHEATVLNPLISSLSAMGVLHDKGQISNEELAFTKSVAFSRFDQTASLHPVSSLVSNVTSTHARRSWFRGP